VLPVWLVWGQICNFCLFELFWIFLLFEKGQMNYFWPFLTNSIFFRFGRLKDDFSRYLATVSGHRMIHFYWKLCTTIFGFAVSGYFLARPKFSRHLLVEWASFCICIHINGWQTCSLEESFAENQIHQRAEKSVCSVNTHRCTGRQIFGGAKDFCPNFLK